MFVRRLALTLAALPLPLLLSGSASAAGLGETCAAAADCDAGLACEVVGGTACACPEGASCEPCEVIEERACVPGPCATDDDCGGDLVCVTYEVPCVGMAMPDCAPDSDCEMPEPEACEPTSASICAPRWVLPCEEDADCGAGFACEASEICACSGGGATPSDPTDPSGADSGSGSDPGGAEFMPPEEDCTCEPSAEKACRPIEVVCEADADCAEGFGCVRAPTAVTCTEPAREGSGGSDSGGSGDDPSGVPACEEVPAEPPTTGVCQPIGWGGGDARGEEFGIPADAQIDDDGATAPTNENVPTGGQATEPAACAGGADASGLLGLALGALVLIALRRRQVV